MSYFQVVAIPIRSRIEPFVDRHIYTEYFQAEARLEELRVIYSRPIYDLRIIVVSANRKEC